MGWKIYFWILLVLSVGGYIPIFMVKGFSLLYVLDVLVCSVGFAGLFCFAFKKKWLQASFWKVYFFIILIWNFSFDFLIMPRIGVNHSIVNSIIGVVILLPLYIGLYLYAFKFLEE